MPTNCCVPLCIKKDKRDKETGKKISFFRFPEDEDLMKQWTHAIRRDVGPYFSINEGTRVCSRHFKTEDLHKSLNGRVSPRPGAVLSIFVWKRSSPRKRPPPTPRFTATTVAKNLTSQDSEAMDLAAEIALKLQRRQIWRNWLFRKQRKCKTPHQNILLRNLKKIY